MTDLLQAYRDQCERLQETLTRIGAEVQELRDCVHAAADGHPELAERYVAAGLLGMQRLEGDTVCTFTAQVGVGCTAQIIAAPQEHIVIRRLWVDPKCAAGFTLELFTVGNFPVLGPGMGAQAIPCELFARRYGSPLIDRICEVGSQVALTVRNVTERSWAFRAVVLGYSRKLFAR